MVTTEEEAREAIRSALLDWRAAGASAPTIAVHADVDGDGVPDFYGLGPGGELALVSGITVHDTVAVSDGSGVEGGGSS